MPYYNPQQGDNYYNPYSNTQQQGPNIGSVLAGAAKSMLLFTGLNMAGRFGAKVISNKAGSMIARYGKGKLGAAARTLDSPSLGGILKATSSGKQAVKAYQKTTKPLREALSRRRTELNNFTGSGFQKARFSTMFKNKTTFVAVIGSKWKQNVLEGAAVSYGIDIALGATKDLGLEKKAIYDVPGQVGNFAKWMAMDSIYGMALPFAGTAAKIAGAAGGDAIKNAFKGSIGKSIAKHAMDNGNVMSRASMKDSFFKKNVMTQAKSNHDRKLQKTVEEKKIGFGRKVAETARIFKDSFNVSTNEIKTSIMTGEAFSKTISKGIGPFKEALRQVKNIKKYANDHSAHKSSPHAGLKAVEFLTNMVDDLNAKPPGSNKSDLSGLTDFFNNAAKNVNKPTFLETVAPGLKPLYNKDIADFDWIKHTYGGLLKHYPRKQAKEFMSSVMNMRVGKNVYSHGSSIKGGGVDLGGFDPGMMMRRGIGKIMNHTVNIPGTPVKFNFGDILRVNKHLAEEPSFEFFKHRKPNLSAGDASVENRRTIGDFAQSKEPLFAYADGKWALVENGQINIINTNLRLKYAAANGIDRAHENIAINRDQILKEAEDANRQRAMRRDKSQSIFGGIADSFGMGIPTIFKRLKNNFIDKAEGKHIRTKLASASLFGSDDFSAFYETISPREAMGSMRKLAAHLVQTTSRVFSDKASMEVIAKKTHNKYLAKDIVNAVNSNRDLMDQVKRLDVTVEGLAKKRLSQNPTYQQHLDNARAFPEQAATHIVTKRLGMGSDMNSYDHIRTNYIMDTFDNWHKMPGSKGGNGEAHPVLKAIPDLLKKGLVTEKEARNLSLFAKLRVFQDEGLFAATGGTGGLPDDLMKGLVKSTRVKANKLKWDVHKEITDVLANSDFRSPKIRVSQERILNNSYTFKSNKTPYVSYKSGARGAVEGIGRSLDVLTGMLEDITPFRKDPIKHTGIKQGYLSEKLNMPELDPLGGNLRYILGIAGKTAAIGAAYRLTDFAFAANPLFNDTALEEGITGFAADTVAKGRLAAAKIADFTGITSSAKYMEGLMPGSSTFIPGAVAGLIAGVKSKSAIGAIGTIGMGAYGFFAGGTANRLASPYIPKLDKSYEDLKKIYSGQEEVEMMKSPTWLLGGTPWEGTKVAGYTPNWYVRAKSRWKEGEVMYGSAFKRLIHEPLPLLGTNIGDVIDPYYMERKHFFSRPYPKTGKLFEEVPIIGPVLSSTIGRIIKPEKTMHQEFLQGEWAGGNDGPYNFATPPPTLQEGMLMMKHTAGNRTQRGITSNHGSFVYNNNKNWAESSANRLTDNMMNAAGLQGFLARTALEKINNSDMTVIPTLESAGRMASQTRAFYDMNLGGMGFLTEPFRRLFTRPEYRKHGINPLPNMMPQWLGDRFTTGDPYTKIQRGELRLPGSAYVATHQDINYSMPGRASMLGADPEHSVQYFTGLLSPLLKKEYDILNTGTTMHKIIQDQLQAEGILIGAEALVYDAKNDISGHVDAVIRDGQGGGGKRAMEIKTISQHGFEKLKGPKHQHIGQINFYLKQLKMQEGSIMYVMRDNPSQVKVFNVKYSKHRWEQDLANLRKSRQVAADMMEQGYVDQYGYSYSWLDRMDILADVSPTSSSYKEARTIVEHQVKRGLLTQKEISKYERTLSKQKARSRQYELYPTRFKGKLFTPDTEVNVQNINENIKAGAEYALPQRILGAAWETMLNSNNIFSNKIMSRKDPIEHYKMSRLYGKEYKPWTEPIQSWAKPYGRGLLSKTNPIEGAMSFGTGGFTIAGYPGAAIGSVVGMIYGGVHGAYRMATGTTYIPNEIEDQRSINKYFDSAQYSRMDRMTQLSDGIAKDEYMASRDSTLTAINNSDNPDIKNLFKAAYFQEKPYLSAFINVKNQDERKDVLRYMPKDMGFALERQWQKMDSAEGTAKFVNNSSQSLVDNRKAVFNRSVLDPSVALDDIKLKTLNEEGYDVHEFGLGWNNQMLRMQDNYNDIAAVDTSELEFQKQVANNGLNSSQVRQAIEGLLTQRGYKSKALVYINNGANDSNNVNITIRRDRSMSVINAFNNRQY